LKTSIVLSAALACLAIATTVHAGDRWRPDVYVDNTGFTGSLGAAHNSSDSNQRISCSVNAFGSPATIYGFCFAQDAAGNSKMCTVDKSMLSLLASINSTSFLEVDFDNQNNCTIISVSDDSAMTPPLAP
jgi:hypothetical protein